jgi:DNA-binding NarL/FixJ family response regulator
MLRVLLADQHEIIRRGVRRLIEAQPGWEVCAEARGGLEVLELALEQRPHVVVTEVALPGVSGVALTARLKQALPSVEILLFTLHDEHDAIMSALAAGARGYVLKGEPDAHLVTAIGALAAHRSFLSPMVSDFLLQAGVSPPPAITKGFTGRELDVVQSVCDGLSNRTSAARLGISIKTVETHRGAALRKAGVHNAGELVRYAIKNKLVVS